MSNNSNQNDTNPVTVESDDHPMLGCVERDNRRRFLEHRVTIRPTDDCSGSGGALNESGGDVLGLLIGDEPGTLSLALLLDRVRS